MSKNYLDIDNATFKIGGKIRVKNVSFSIKNKGDIVCILGPSGIGKTTILRTIAGLEKLENGTIKLKGKLISSKDIHIEPEDRNIALSFQDNSLFPHYTIERNIQLALERKNINNKKKVNSKEIIKLLGISKILHKYPHQVSAGEAQRASLARSLSSNPDLLLLDEPLSNIDTSFKEEIQVELKQILNKFKITTIIVTHDSYEAFYLGNKCGVVLDNKLEQYDTPYNLYHFPNSIKIVKFLNRGVLIPAVITSPKSLENEELGTITGNFAKQYPIGSKVKLLLQPEDLEHDDKSNLKLEVIDIKFRGSNFIYTLMTETKKRLSVILDSHHIHQHKLHDKFGIKRPIHIEHIVCFN